MSNGLYVSGGWGLGDVLSRLDFGLQSCYHSRFPICEKPPTKRTTILDAAMYAIIKDGGKQHKVEEGQTLLVDYRDLTKGDELKFESVLAVSGDDGLKLGSPTVDGASVTAEVLGVEQGQKLTVLKFRRRKNSRRKNGHRQLYTSVQIKKIEAS